MLVSNKKKISSVLTNKQNNLRIIFLVFLVFPIFSNITPLSAEVNGINYDQDLYEPSRMVAIPGLRIWYTNTIFDNITAIKWSPSNVTEYGNITLNTEFKSLVLHDLQELQQQENFGIFIFNWSVALEWTLQNNYFYPNGTVNVSPLYDINNQPYLDFGHLIETSLILSNCSFLSFKNNGTVLAAYEDAMDAENYSLANELVPEANDTEEYLKNKPGPFAYSINVSTQRLARLLEEFWYIDHVDVFYNRDGSRDLYNLSTPLIEYLIEKWGVLTITVIFIGILTIVYVYWKKK